MEDESIRYVESVIFMGTQNDASGNFYTDGFVELLRLKYKPVAEVIDGFEIIEELGAFSEDTLPHPSLDSTESFRADWSSGNEQSLFSLRPGAASVIPVVLHFPVMDFHWRLLT